MDPYLLHNIQSIAQSLQPHAWPKTLVEWGQLALVLLTLATLVVLIVYTKAARDQAKATSRILEETQRQTEQSLIPVLVLTTAVDGNVTVFIVKNIGNGPALNAYTTPFSLDGLHKLAFHHRGVVGASQHDRADLLIDSAGNPLRPVELCHYIQRAGPDVESHTKIHYQAVNRRWYHTSHTIKLTKGKLDLIIEFDEFDKTDGPSA
jgi:hypothetical protein